MELENTYVRGELKIEEIQNHIEESRLRWFGHVKRMDEHRIPKGLLKMKMGGIRHRGIPRTQRIGQVKRDVERKGRG
jgi:hypothetical protein